MSTKYEISMTFSKKLIVNRRLASVFVKSNATYCCLLFPGARLYLYWEPIDRRNLKCWAGRWKLFYKQARSSSVTLGWWWKCGFGLHKHILRKHILTLSRGAIWWDFIPAWNGRRRWSKSISHLVVSRRAGDIKNCGIQEMRRQYYSQLQDSDTAKKRTLDLWDFSVRYF